MRPTGLQGEARGLVRKVLVFTGNEGWFQQGKAILGVICEGLGQVFNGEVWLDSLG